MNLNCHHCGQRVIAKEVNLMQEGKRESRCPGCGETLLLDLKNCAWCGHAALEQRVDQLDFCNCCQVLFCCECRLERSVQVAEEAS